MSIDPFDDDSNDEHSKKVQDEEGTVDQKVKQRILNARQNVDDAEATLYVNAPTSDTGVDPQDQHLGYQTIVRQYIRAIKPLLTNQDIPQSEYYRNEVLLWKTEELPPEGRHPWPQACHPDVSKFDFCREYGLPSHVDLPEPKRAEIRGLGGILEEQNIVLKWSFDIREQKNAAGTDLETLAKPVPIPKRVFDAAVEEADQFLQQAGIGLEITAGDPHGKT